MADDSQTLQILIDIRAKLDALAQTGSGLQDVTKKAKDAHEQSSRLGELFRQGLGIGSGMELARRAVDLFRDSIIEAVQASSQLAAEIERVRARLGLQAEAYQTLAFEAREAGTKTDQLLSSLGQYRQKLGQALLDPTQGTALRQLGLDAQQLANQPIERQLEQVAVALDTVTNSSIKARIAQDLFGAEGADSLMPILEKLRTEGLDRMRASAEATGAILSGELSDALIHAERRADEAHKALAVALAPANLQLTELRTSLASGLARNVGPIESGLEAALAGAFTVAVSKALTKVAASGALEAALQNFGKALAGPIGIGLAAALGAYIISELQRRALESNQRSDAFDARAHSTPSSMLKALPDVSSDDQLRTLYNKAVTAYQQAQIDRKKLIMMPAQDVTDETRDNIRSLEQEMDLLARLIPMIKAKGPAYVEANSAAIKNFDRLKEAQTDLFVVEANHQNFQAATWHTQKERDDEEYKYLRGKIILLDEIIKLTKQLPLKPGQDAEDRNQELQKLEAMRAAADTARGNMVPFGAESDLQKTRDQYSTFKLGMNDQRGQRLTAGQGMESGAEQYVMSLGSQGEQVAAALQSSLGATVDGISDGIMGWITHAKTFGQAMASLGGTILQTVIKALVQIGVQMLINAALGTGIRAKESAQNKAAVGENALVAGMKALAQLGPIWGTLAFIGALAAILALTKGFSSGGYTGAGGRYEVAGPVHRGEVVFSQDDVARHGGPAAVESLRLGGPRMGIETYAIPAGAQASAAGASATVLGSGDLSDLGGGSRSGNQNHYIFFDREAMRRAMASDMEGIAHDVYDKRQRS